LLRHGQSIAKRVRERLSADDDKRQRLDPLHALEGLKGLLVIVALGIGHVEEGTSAQPVVDLTGLGDERRDLRPAHRSTLRD
jgi:hypothetical protein